MSYQEIHEQIRRDTVEKFIDALPCAPVENVAKKLGISTDEVKRQRIESRKKLIGALTGKPYEGRSFMNNTLRAALDYHARGWSFYPTQPRSKMPLNALLPQLPNEKGELRATWKPFQTECPTIEQITEWYSRCPLANLALITGAVSGIVALDLDSPEAIEYARRQFGTHWPDTPTACSNRGWHLYFRHPHFPVRGNTGIPDLELRGDGASITAPPSVHASGHRYNWFVSPDEAPLAQLPEWLWRIARSNEHKREEEANRPRGTFSFAAREEHGKYMNAVLSNVLRDLQSVSHERNKALNVAALKLGGFVASGMIDEATVVGALESAGRAMGLDEREILPTIRSGLRKGLSQPKPLPQSQSDKSSTRWAPSQRAQTAVRL